MIKFPFPPIFVPVFGLISLGFIVPAFAWATWFGEHKDAVAVAVAGTLVIVMNEVMQAWRFSRHEKWESANTSSLVEHAIGTVTSVTDKMLEAMKAYDGHYGSVDATLRDIKHQLVDLAVQVERTKKDVEDLQKRNYQALGILPRQKEK